MSYVQVIKKLVTGVFCFAAHNPVEEFVPTRKGPKPRMSRFREKKTPPPKSVSPYAPHCSRGYFQLEACREMILNSCKTLEQSIGPHSWGIPVPWFRKVFLWNFFSFQRLDFWKKPKAYICPRTGKKISRLFEMPP